MKSRTLHAAALAASIDFRGSALGAAGIHFATTTIAENAIKTPTIGFF